MKNALCSLLAVYILIPPLPTLAAGTFGERHFIIGVNSPHDVRSTHTKPSASQVAEKPQVYFSPDHNLEKIFTAFIDNELESINIAIYFFTNNEIAKALGRACKRGVLVAIITDQSCVESKFNKIRALYEMGIPIYVYKNEQQNSLMHNKFAVFGKNKENKKIVWTGSFNFTRAANLYNQENAVVLYDACVAEEFQRRFDTLKMNCVLLGSNSAKKSMHARWQEKEFALTYNNKKFGNWVQRNTKNVMRKISELWHEHSSSSLT